MGYFCNAFNIWPKPLFHKTKMTPDEIRRSFFVFFESKEHRIVPSAPMVMNDDPTLMFTNAGMNQFKDIFLGYSDAREKRVANTQKCLRVSGKHNDLEEVGVDTYHHTMFEMLGNWSFGDYFKEEAITWAWEYLIDVLKLNKDDIYVTVFGGDVKEGLSADEDAENIWKKHIDADRVLRCGKKDNFWEMGETGPCGPCSEIHIDIRAEDDRDQDARELVNKDHPHVIELWNLVFMQFDRKKDGHLEDLPSTHVDTGMGFERLAMVVQGHRSNYDSDVFRPMIAAIEGLSNKQYGTDEAVDIAMRVIADHLRAVSFSISDGQMPSNTGAGYVIRRILRRAVRYGSSTLGLKEAFIHSLVPMLVKQMGEQFPELKANESTIVSVIKEEENSFLRTLDQGVDRIEQLLASGEKTIDGRKAFELFDTYGFPIDLTVLIAKEHDVEVDMPGFEKALQEQKERSRGAVNSEAEDWTILDQHMGNPFVGYDKLISEVQIKRYRKVTENDQEHYDLVLENTPFYPEGGGQVGDTGELISENETIKILDTRKENDLIIHKADRRPEDPAGSFKASVNSNDRKRSELNHSATHLMHHALREILGEHVEQKGSLVTPDKLRFDLSHFKQISAEEIDQVNDRVNEMIRSDFPLEEDRTLSLDKAKAMGAMALFGEKYGDEVRVIRFGPSTELCGGTHVESTGRIGTFIITSESALASGIRRIEALTGQAALDHIKSQIEELREVRSAFKDPNDLLKTIKSVLETQKSLSKELEKTKKGAVKDLVPDLLKSAEEIDGVKFIAQKVDLDAKSMKDLAFNMKSLADDLFLVLGSAQNGKALLTVMVSDSLVEQKGLKADEVIKAISGEIKGGGGGQPFFATAGGKDATGLENAFLKAKDCLG